MGSIFKPKRIENGKKVPYEHWYIKYVDETGNYKKIKGFKDKEATKQLMKEKEREAERKRAGLRTFNTNHLLRKLETVIDEYLLHLVGDGTPLGSTHYKESKRILTTVKDKCEWKLLGDLRGEQFGNYLNKMASEGKAPDTQNKHHQIIRAFCNWCVRQSYLEASPLTRVRMRKVGEKGKRRRRRAITPAELVRLLQVVPEHRAAIYTIAATSGLRRKELNQIEKQDAQPCGDNPLWTIRGTITKNGKAARLPMAKECAEALRPLWDQATSATSRLLKVPHIETFKLDLKRAGLARQDAEGNWIDFHSLRYTFCMTLANVLPIQKVKLLMRHSTIKLTADLYGALGLEDVAEDVWTLPPLISREPSQSNGSQEESKQKGPSEEPPQSTGPTTGLGDNFEHRKERAREEEKGRKSA